MNSNFGYTGRVTLKTMHNDRVICTQHFNSGTDLLFKAYAMALSGQNITPYLPSYINIGYENDSKFNSILRNADGLSIVRTYSDIEVMTGNSSKETPCTRITITLTSSMFKELSGTGNFQIRLLSSHSGDNNVLAMVNLEENDAAEFLNAINSTPSGTQIIIVWDLYVENNKEAN